MLAVWEHVFEGEHGTLTYPTSSLSVPVCVCVCLSLLPGYHEQLSSECLHHEAL